MRHDFSIGGRVAANICLGKVNVVASIHAMRCHECHLNIAVIYCLELGGELPRGLPCVFTGTVIALSSANDRVLLTGIDSVLDSHHVKKINTSP